MPAGATPRTMPLMVSLRRVGFVKVLLAALFGGLLLLGPLSPPASAGVITTECTLQARSNPSTVGGDAAFRFFAAARSPEDSPPAPYGEVAFYDVIPIPPNLIGTATMLPLFGTE